MGISELYCKLYKRFLHKNGDVLRNLHGVTYHVSYLIYGCRQENKSGGIFTYYRTHLFIFCYINLLTHILPKECTLICDKASEIFA